VVDGEPVEKRLCRIWAATAPSSLSITASPSSPNVVFAGMSDVGDWVSTPMR
jgi:hypothetical protein